MNQDQENVQHGTKPFWGPWTTLALTAGVVVLYFIIQLGVAIVFAAVLYAKDPNHDTQALTQQLESNGFLLSLTVFASNPVCTALTIALAGARGRIRRRESLAVRRVRRSTLFFWLVGILAFALASDLLTASLGRPVVPEFMREAYRTSRFPPLLWIALVIAAPLFEETLFRGFLYTGLERSRLGAIGAVGLTALAWALIHVQYGVYEIALIFVAGVVLGCARARTKSIIPCLAMHSTMNLLATVQAALA